MADWQVVTADVMDWAAGYDGPKFYALLCDPPYHLMPDKRGITRYNSACQQKWRNRMATAGFMGKHWDGGDIAFRPDTWAALAEHLHPGAFGMAFASSRGWHRLAVAIEGYMPIPWWEIKSAIGLLELAIETRDWSIVEKVKIWLEGYNTLRQAIEDAGMIIQPSIFGWATGQSFPKATRIDTQIDKRAGKLGEREVIGSKLGQPGYSIADNGRTNQVYGDLHNPEGECAITAPATPLARAWAGHRYGGQVLKNALEPIIVFQKPWEGKRLDCIVETGAGSMWVDGGRIEAGQDYTSAGWGPRYGASSMPNMGGHQTRPWVQNAIAKGKPVKDSQPSPQGRWPSNFTLTHSPLDNDDGCHESCPVRRLGEMSGERGGGNHKYHKTGISGCYGPERQKGDDIGKGDTGTAARFYYQASWSYEIAERLATVDPVCYQAKASRTERESGLLGVIPCAQCGGVDTETHVNDKGKTVACRRCSHPTVKPISLTRWLATLLLPPPEYAPRRLLIPFAGSGSEMIGALLAGWEEITGIELLPENTDIADARCHWWHGWGELGFDASKDILKESKRTGRPKAKQLELT